VAPRTVLGAHVNAGVIRVAVLNSAGEVLAQDCRRAERPDGLAGMEQVAELVLEVAGQVLRATAPSLLRPDVFGLAVPARLLDGAPGHPLGAGESELGACFSQRLGCPARVMTSQAAAAFAECRVGAGRGAGSLLLVELGEEIEVAMVADGEPQHLHDAGHMVIDTTGPACRCGQRGCWQAMVSPEAIASRALRAASRGGLGPLVDLATGGPQAVTAAAICHLAAGGDSIARGVVEETGRYLALGLANLIGLLSPEVAMIGGYPAGVVGSLRHAAEAELKLSPRAAAFAHCVFLSPELGEAAPAIGAAMWAVSQPG
jgi:glucokinase